LSDPGNQGRADKITGAGQHELFRNKKTCAGKKQGSTRKSGVDGRVRRMETRASQEEENRIKVARADQE